MRGGVQDGLGRDLRLVDRRHRLGLAGHRRSHPAELGRVRRRQLNHRRVHVRLGVQQFAADRLVEALDRVLGAAVRRLERDAAVGERGSHLHDRAAVPGQHAPQRGHRAVHVPQVGDLGDASELRGRQVRDWGQRADERVVHPHLDRPEPVLHFGGRRLDRVRVRDIHRQRQRLATGRPDVLSRGRQPFLASGQQRHPVPARGEPPGHRAPDPAAGPGHHHHTSLTWLSHTRRIPTGLTGIHRRRGG